MQEQTMVAKTPPRLLLTIEEAAQALGLSRAFLYPLVMQGIIPSLKFGAARRIPLAALEAFVEQQIAEQRKS
jgi:excisionase family DNA binding protein